MLSTNLCWTPVHCNSYVSVCVCVCVCVCVWAWAWVTSAVMQWEVIVMWCVPTVCLLCVPTMWYWCQYTPVCIIMTKSSTDWCVYTYVYTYICMYLYVWPHWNRCIVASCTIGCSICEFYSSKSYMQRKPFECPTACVHWVHWNTYTCTVYTKCTILGCFTLHVMHAVYMYMHLHVVCDHIKGM